MLPPTKRPFKSWASRSASSRPTPTACSSAGASDRQVAAIAGEVLRQLKDAGRRPLHVEGESHADWVLLDYGDFVVHVFTEERRTYYGLDNLWGDAPRLESDDLGIGEAEFT